MSLSVFDLVREHHLHVIFSSFLCALILKRTLTTHKRNSNGLPLPPGPKGFPIIGNLPDMPTDKQWLVYNQWSKTYGRFCHNESFLHIISFFIAGDMVYFVLNTLRRASDLSDKRSTNYSDRPRMPMLVEL